jgi:hypothetical protein
MLKYLLGGQLESSLLGFKNNLNTENGISSQFKEVVIKKRGLKPRPFRTALHEFLLR